MILIGQYDSPFVRRVGIALTLYGIAFEHRPWSTFSDADKIAPYNPLLRVPTLVLDNGDVLVETQVILDYLDGLMPPDQRLFPVTQPERRKAMKVAALAGGLSDKAISLFYELRLHDQTSDLWVARCGKQIDGTLALLEKERVARPTPYWFGDGIGHADIAVAASLRHYREAHRDIADLSAFPVLRAHAESLEGLPVFQAIQQPFIAPA